MLRNIRHILTNDLVKVSSWTGAATLIRIAAQFITSKVLAVLVGPSGLAILGQLYNVGNIVQSIGSGGISIGVTKYVAEHSNNTKEVGQVIKASLKITFYWSLICSLIVILCHSSIGYYSFNTNEYNGIILTLGLTLMLFSFNNLFGAIINGLKNYRLFIVINIATSIVNVIITVLFVGFWGIYGALLGFIISPAFLFFVSYLLLYQQTWFSFDFLRAKVDFSLFKKFGKFSLVAINNAVVGALAQIVIRSMIIKNMSIETAGIWDGMNRLSNAYLILLTTSIQVYYLPTLASISDPKKLWSEIMRSERVVLPLIIFLFVLLFLCRGVIVNVLFSPEFYLMKNVFLYQLVGDLVKVAGWMLAYTMYAKAMTRSLIITDNLFTLINIALCFLLISSYGLNAIYYAYIINGTIYLIFIYLFLKHYILKGVYG